MGISLYEMEEMFSAKDLSAKDAKEFIGFSTTALNAKSLARSMTKYSGMLSPAQFSCKRHGVFKMTPAWVAKRGCPSCAAAYLKAIGVLDTLEKGASDEDDAWLDLVRGVNRA